MSAPTLGAPIGPEIEDDSRRIVFDHIPHLRELLQNGGWPGVTYVQVCVHNLKAAADRQERPSRLRPIRGATYYSIQGPKGRADMALVGSGTPIPGASPDSGARLFFTDGEVEDRTGLQPLYPIWLRSMEEIDAVRRERLARAQRAEEEGREGDVRVQTRDAAFRESDGTPSEKPKAGSRHRPVRKQKKERVKGQNLKGHNHGPQFGRLTPGCEGCEKIFHARQEKESAEEQA